MNKAELIDKLAVETSLTKADATSFLDIVISTIESEISAGNEVALFGFGKFSPTARAARDGRNPQTGETVKIAASKGVKFAAAAAFKTKLNPKKAAPAKKAPAKKKA